MSHDIDIDSMPAGAEMDRLVAERVMQWKAGWLYGDMARGCIVGRPERAGRGLEFDGWLAWSPSTRIDHAWEVVAAIADSDRVLVLCQYADHACAAVLHYRQPITPDEMVSAPTVPLAICRSVLKAVSA